MNFGKLNDWLQVVGLFAVVGSLIFVGLQMRQDQEIALSQAYQSRADQSIDLLLAALESETVQSFWAKVDGIVEEELTPPEIAIGMQFARANLVHWENVHYQYQRGFVTQEHWDTQLANIRRLLPLRIFRNSYERSEGAWRASFAGMLDQVLEESGSDGQ